MVMGNLRCPEVDREEIVNACGVDDFHDGANVIRTACIVGMAKASETFEPVLAQLGYRLAHVLRRLLPISMHLLQKDGVFNGLPKCFNTLKFASEEELNLWSYTSLSTASL
jgi:hypothetical protein